MADDNPVDDSSIFARLAGYAWDEIKSFTNSPQQEAVDNGYTPEEIANERGQTPPSRAQDAMSAYWQGKVASDDMATAGLQKAPQVPLTPLDAMAADRIASHAGTTAPPVQAPSEDFIEPPPAIDFNDSDMRGHYADALLSGHVGGPRDFAEKYAGAFLGTPGVPTDDASQAAVVRAAGSLADTLPTNEDLTDSAIAIAHRAGVELTGDSVKTVKNNLVENWRLTGQPMPAAIQQASSDPDFASKITQPPTPPTPPDLPWWASLSGEVPGEGLPQDTAKAVSDLIVQHFSGIVDDWSKWADHQQEIAARLEGKSFAEQTLDPEKMNTAMSAAFGMMPANLEGKVAGIVRDLPMPKVTVVDPSLEGAAAVKQVPADEAFAPEAPSSQVARDLATKIDRIHELSLENAAPEGGGTFFQRKLQEMQGRGEITPAEAEKAPQLSNDQLAEVANDHAAGNGIRGFFSELMGDESGSFKPGPYRTPEQQAARDAYVKSRDYMRTEIVRNESLANQEIAHWTDYLEPSHPAVNQGMKEWTRELDKGAAGNPMGTSIGQMMDYIEGRSNGVVMAPGSKLAPVADSLRDVEQAMDAKLRQQAADGIISYDGFIEDHFRHQWTDGTAAANAFKGTGKLGESGGLRERTTFPTIADGLRAGQSLKYPNPLEAELHDASGKILYSYAADMIDKAEKDGFLYRSFSPKNDGDVRVNGRIGERAIPMQKPVAVRQAEAQARDALATAQASGVTDLQPYVDAVRDATEAAKPTAQIQNLYGNPGAVTAINDWLSAGLYARPSTASLYDKALYAKNISTAYKLIMPIFHAKVVALGSLASGLGQAMEEAGRGQLSSAMLSLGKVATVVPNIAENMTVGRRAMQSYVKMSGDPIVQYLTEAGLNFGPRQRIYQMGSAPSIVTSIKRGSLGQELVANFKSIGGDPRAESDLKRVLRVPDRVLQAGLHEAGRLLTTATAPLFDHVIPMIKTGASYGRLQSFIKANPTASPDVILAKAKQIAGDVDNRLGELNMNTVFWPKTAKQIANMTALSQGWVYGTYRGALGAMGLDIERGALKWNPTYASSAAGAVMAYGYVNAIMTWLNTGQAPWQSETPIRDLMNYRTGGVDTKGNVERGMFPAELKEWFDISKIVAIGMAGYQKAGAVGTGNALPAVTNYVLGKINPFLAFLHTAMTGEDAIGNKFWTPSGFDKIMKATFDPIVLEQIASEKKGSHIGFWSSLMGERVAPPQAENWSGFIDQMQKVFDRNEKQQSARNARENAQLANPDPTIPPPNVRGGGGRTTVRQREINAAAGSDFGQRADAEAALERTRQTRAARPALGRGTTTTGNYAHETVRDAQGNDISTLLRGGQPAGLTGNYRRDAWEKALRTLISGQQPATDHTGRQQRYSRQAVYQRAARSYYARQRAVHGVVGGQEAIGGGAQGV